MQTLCSSECETQVHCKYSIPESLSNLRKQLREKEGKGKRTGCSSRALLQLGIAGGQKNPLEQSPL